VSIETEEEILAERLNEGALVFRGCTKSEFILLIIFSLLFWLPTSVLIGLLIGKASLGIGASLLFIIGTVWAGTSFISVIKRGRPHFYYQQRVFIFLQTVHFKDYGLILRSGYWDIGRTKYPKTEKKLS